jgi:hypothetical protein
LELKWSIVSLSEVCAIARAARRHHRRRAQRRGDDTARASPDRAIARRLAIAARPMFRSRASRDCSVDSELRFVELRPVGGSSRSSIAAQSAVPAHVEYARL